MIPTPNFFQTVTLNTHPFWPYVREYIYIHLFCIIITCLNKGVKRSLSDQATGNTTTVQQQTKPWSYKICKTKEERDLSLYMLQYWLLSVLPLFFLFFLLVVYLRLLRLNHKNFILVNFILNVSFLL